MRILPGLAMLLFGATLCPAQDGRPPTFLPDPVVPRPSQPARELPPAASLKAIQFEVVLAIATVPPEIAETASREPSGAVMLETIRNWSRDGLVKTRQQIQTSTLEGLESSVRFGETVSIVTGRNFMPGRGGGPASVPTFSQQEIGTILRLKAGSELEGKIPAQLTFEQSRFEPMPEAPAAEGDGPKPPVRKIVMIDNTLVFQNGVPQTLSCAVATDGSSTVVTVLVATATVRIP